MLTHIHANENVPHHKYSTVPHHMHTDRQTHTLRKTEREHLPHFSSRKSVSSGALQLCVSVSSAHYSLPFFFPPLFLNEQTHQKSFIILCFKPCKLLPAEPLKLFHFLTIGPLNFIQLFLFKLHPVDGENVPWKKATKSKHLNYPTSNVVG